ncbi:helix-turn-helix domain-containing protein [Rhodococcus hoagii]|nr:helix-turn-helix domain-containing protein [Prescottella equi]NKR72166.1 helix-turn-helix domain-containing protein [Prescottella equi]NKR91388.1 helix-turn-helix domain-containing protein [Prescottella equi]NKS16345.1 helix-turn-helix domain-containing protein [Prescottella equi]
MKSEAARRASGERSGHVPAQTPTGAALPVAGAHEGHTRAAVVQLLVEEGPISATDIGARLGLSAAGVRRHLDVLIEAGEAQEASAASWRQRGRGRPAKLFQITAAGRGKLGHTYDDLAGAAMRQLREIGGDAAIEDFARRRVQSIVGSVAPVDDDEPEAVESTAEEIAEAFTSAGFAASIRPVGNGVQICQHHCPISHVAEEFPELCEAERAAFAELLGTHVQQLATIANGDCACTTHVPLALPRKTS